LRSLRLLVASTSLVAALAAPAAAQASSGYVVSLRNPADATCQAAILDVTMAYDVVPSQIYTSSLCGFSASLPKAKAREMALDHRVEFIQPDGAVTVA
jgi:hypothetical protein